MFMCRCQWALLIEALSRERQLEVLADKRAVALFKLLDR